MARQRGPGRGGGHRAAASPSSSAAVPSGNLEGRKQGWLLIVALVGASLLALYLTSTGSAPHRTPATRSHDLRARFRRAQWAEVAAYTEQLDPTHPAAELVGLLPVAIAARGFSELVASGGLGELCTGCTEAERRTDTDFARAIKGLAPHQRPEDIVSAVFTSIRTRDLVALRLLVTLWPAAAQTQFSERDPTTALHVAVSTASEVLALSKRLVRGGDVSPELWQWLEAVGGDTAAIRAESISGEISAGAIRPAINGWTSLFVQVLLAAGASPLARDQLGRTPLHVASFGGNQVAADTLLNRSIAGGDATLVNELDRAGNSALDLALVNSFAGTARMLRERWGAKSSRNTAAIIAKLRRPDGPSAPPDAAAESGGWGGINDDESATPTPSGTFINVVTELDRKQFTAEYLIPRQPVLFRGGCANWTDLRTLLTKKAFIAKFGDRTLPVSTIPYGDQYTAAVETGQRQLRAFVADDVLHASTGSAPMYIFEQRQLQAVLPEIAAAVPTSLPFLVGANLSPPQFYLGGNGSGAPPHFHGDAWNALAWGSKRWFLFPPNEARFSRIPISEWVDSRLGGITDPAPIEVLQQSGDILFVPKGWGHAVLNLAPSVGVACEFDSVVSRY